MTRIAAIALCLCALVSQAQLAPKEQQDFLAAVNAQKAGELSKAKELYKAILHVQPRFVGAHLNLSLIYIRENDRAEALSHVRAALAVEPVAPETYMFAARVYGVSGDVKECERLLGKVTGKLTQSPAFLILRGTLRASKQELAGADRDLTLAHAKAPDDVQAIVTLASVKLRLKKGTEAVNLLDRAAAKSSHDATLWQGLAQASLITGDVKKDALALEKLHRLRPDDIETATLLASVYMSLNRPNDGIALIGSMISRFPNNGKLRIAQADMLMRQQRWNDAEQQLHAAQEYLPNDPQVNDRIARVALEQGRFDEAATYWKDLTVAQKTNVLARQRLEQVYQRQHAINSLIECYRDWMRDIPNDPYPSRMLASLYRQERDYERSDQEFKRHLRQFPDDAIGRRDYAFLLEATGKRLEAAAQYRECIRLNKNDIESRLSLGEDLFNVGQDAESVKVLEEAKKQFPDNDRVYMTLAAHYEQRKENALAEKEYRDLLRTQPKHLEAMARLANLLEQRKDIDGTLALYEKLVVLSHNPAVDFARIPELLWRSGRKDEAKRRWTERIAAHPDDAVLHLQCGQFYDSQCGDLEAAGVQYREAKRLRPTMPEPRTRLAGVYERQKKDKESEAELGGLLKMDPDSPSTYAILYRHYLGLNRTNDYWDLILPYAENGTKEDAALLRIVDLAPALKREPVALDIAKKRTRVPKPTVNAWIALSHAYRDSGDWPQAVESFSKAAHINKKDTGTLRDYTMTAEEHGTKEQALSAYKFYTECLPADVWGLMKYGNLLRGAKRLPEALGEFDKVLKMFPDNADALKAKSEVEKLLG